MKGLICFKGEDEISIEEFRAKYGYARLAIARELYRYAPPRRELSLRVKTMEELTSGIAEYATSCQAK